MLSSAGGHRAAAITRGGGIALCHPSRIIMPTAIISKAPHDGAPRHHHHSRLAAAAVAATTPFAVRNHYTHPSPGDYRFRPTGSSALWSSRSWSDRAFTVGIGGPVGSGKTALVLALTRLLRDRTPLGVVTNDIFTQEDAEFLIRNDALTRDRIEAVETGGCPHAAIREDVSANLAALERLTRGIVAAESEKGEGKKKEPLLLCESGGDNLAANFSPELADYTVYVIDVSGGDKVPRKGGPGITQSDLLIINKIDLAEAVGADLAVMDRDARAMRGNDGPTVFASVKNGIGIDAVVGGILRSFCDATGAEVDEDLLRGAGRGGRLAAVSREVTADG